MMPNIRIDRDVYAFLQHRAQPFVDTPNTVLRRLLGLDPAKTHEAPDESDQAETRPSIVSMPADGSGPKRTIKRRVQRVSRRNRRQTPRIPAGSLLPENDYVVPLLTALAERGGSASAREIIEAVGEQLRTRLSPADNEALPSGVVRWQNRVQFVRLRLVEEGLLAKDSPRGVWALTAAGRARVTETNQGPRVTPATKPELTPSKR